MSLCHGFYSQIEGAAHQIGFLLEVGALALGTPSSERVYLTTGSRFDYFIRNSCLITLPQGMPANFSLGEGLRKKAQIARIDACRGSFRE
jgi:hypothetical protein